MSSELKTNKISPATGTAFTLGDSGDTFTVPSGVTLTNSGTATGFGLFTSYSIIVDSKASETSGGTATSGAWRTRDLNLELADPDGIVSISSNRFTLTEGSYLITWESPFCYVDYIKTRLYDYTNTTEIGVSGVGYTTSVADRAEQTYWAHGALRVTPSGSTEYEIQYECQTTRATNGLGQQGYSLSGLDQFTRVVIFKEA